MPEEAKSAGIGQGSSSWSGYPSLSHNSEDRLLAIDHSAPVENVASLVNGFLIHVVVSHRRL
jgi:hypothetical protein